MVYNLQIIYFLKTRLKLMIEKFTNSGIRIMQDVLQIEALGIPLHVELTELLGFRTCTELWA